MSKQSNNHQTWQKYSLFTATHSFKSSPSGSITASRRFPLPSVAAACFIRSYWCVPSGMFFLGLNVLVDRLPLQKDEKRERILGKQCKYSCEMRHVAISFGTQLIIRCLSKTMHTRAQNGFNEHHNRLTTRSSFSVTQSLNRLLHFSSNAFLQPEE